MKRGLIFAAVAATVVLAAGNARANAPAPWYACDGLKPGDRCGMGQYYDGYCVMQVDCTDATETDVNECLWCENSDEFNDDGGCSVGRRPRQVVFWFQLLAAAVGLGLIGVRRFRRKRRR